MKTLRLKAVVLCQQQQFFINRLGYGKQVYQYKTTRQSAYYDFRVLVRLFIRLEVNQFLACPFILYQRPGRSTPYPRKPVFFETRQSIFKRESEDLVQVGFNTQANSGIAQHLYNTQFARECTRSSNVEELPPLSFSARSGTLLGWIYRLKTRIENGSP